MSAGNWDYAQHRIREAAVDVNESAREYSGDGHRYHGITLSQHVLVAHRLKELAKALELQADRMHRLDMLLSSDDGIDTFMEKWK